MTKNIADAFPVEVKVSEKIEQFKVFDSFREDLAKMYSGDSDKIQKTLDILAEAAEETAAEQIRVVPSGSLWRRLKSWTHIRFAYGIHWEKPYYPLRFLRNHFIQYLYDCTIYYLTR